MFVFLNVNIQINYDITQNTEQDTNQGDLDSFYIGTDFPCAFLFLYTQRIFSGDFVSFLLEEQVPRSVYQLKGAHTDLLMNQV